MDHEKKLNDIFTKVKTQPQSSSFQETKALFLTSQGSETRALKKKRITLKKVLMMIGIVGLITSVALLFGTEEAVKTIVKKGNKEEVSIKRVDKVEQGTMVVKMSPTEVINVEGIEETYIENTEVWEQVPPPVGFVIPKYAPRIDYGKKLEIARHEFRFPVLTKKEIQETKKQKEKMIKALAKIDRKRYKYIPAGSFTYKGVVVSVQAFLIQKSEVSNLEYRTFLFDLLIQGRKSEFREAAPSQEKWSELGKELNYMQDNYFSDPKFNDYPVCNVSPKAVEMYCKWLTLSLDQSHYPKRMDHGVNDVRIPYRSEWVKAASTEGKNLPYSWSMDTLNGDKNKAVDKHGMYRANFKLPKNDSNAVVSTNPNSITTLGSLFGKEMITVNASFHRAYEANGLHNICGNVAEIVCNSKIDHKGLSMRDKGYGTAGGGWMNTAEEIKILNEELHVDLKEGHPNVGFRVVMTYTRKDLPLVGRKGN